MKKQLLSLLSLSLILAGCTGWDNLPNNSSNSSNNSSSSQTSSSSSSTIVERKVTVKFYLDFTLVAAGDVYYTVEVDNGGLIPAKPDDPTESPFPGEYPVFKGWSRKEIINDDADLWNFATDKVVANKGEFAIFGIWVAEGE